MKHTWTTYKKNRYVLDLKRIGTDENKIVYSYRFSRHTEDGQETLITEGNDLKVPALTSTRPNRRVALIFLDFATQDLALDIPGPDREDLTWHCDGISSAAWPTK